MIIGLSLFLSLSVVQPLARWCDLPRRDAAKMPESAWKLTFYTASWSYSTYLLFLTDYPFFHDPPSVFYGWKATIDVPKDIAIAYLAQCSFYGHAIYATVYMDAWRKDSVVMLVHHVITLALIAFSYAFRYHNVGILVLFLHDANDILLEFTKLNVYFKNRAGVRHKLNDVVSNIGCCSFAISWFWFRLYWFPLKVLYATCYSSLQSVPNIPFYFFFNILLLILTLMNIYWFLYIILLVVKVLTGQVSEVNDVREYDIEDSPSPAVYKKYNHLHSSKDGLRQRNGIIRGGSGVKEVVVAKMATSRLEKNFLRLLVRCESMAGEKREEKDWRLEKYVGALQEMLVELKKHLSKPAAEVLNEYTRKVEFMKGLLEAEKLPNPTEKALANQFLAPGKTSTTGKERLSATQTVHLQMKARYTGEMRGQLLGLVSAPALSVTRWKQTLAPEGSEVTELRKRSGLEDEKQTATELDAVLHRHHNMQERLAEEMLSLARNLKNNTLAAQSVIKQDNQTLTQSLRMADQNFEKLKVESERLEQHTKKSVNWLLWLMLVVVCFTFISMILFIRIFPKLR
ncbi:hypothetical protein chiPu_0007099 [Chiloscyllium punctatum]|uniref:Vesicle transport protein USE1 n=1 Tax=Chiloscyllium punctatum TaxID=137246 RepID=A0A401SE26_CHIPU|nr:hypothetical protein [Chiloscyllium punctatum]